MANRFQENASPRLSVSRFNMPFDVKYTFKLNKIVPTAAWECYPGDVFKIRIENFLRFLPLISPIMHRVRVKTRFFFVPNRLTWSGWEDFITGKTPDVEAPYITPMATGNTPMVGSIGDYLGYPTEIPNDDLQMSAFPGAAYCLIYDEWFRHQYLQNEIFQPLVAGNNAGPFKTMVNNFSPMPVNVEKDYFTACLPFAQAGDPVTLPLVDTENGTVPVNLDSTFPTADLPMFRETATGNPAGAGSVNNSTTPGRIVNGSPSNPTTLVYDPMGTLQVQLNANAVTINQLRNAFAVQSLLERFMRGGQRYIETMFATFGEKAQDARLQRPEYIGGANQNMVISEVLSSAQTINAGDDVVNPVGAMAGHGISVGSSDTFSYRCHEHGWIIGVITVTPATAYQQGLHRSFSRKNYLDYYWPDFAHLGEQAVLLKEIYAQSANAIDGEATFGYLPPFEELRTMNSRVAGLMKTDFDFWHFGRIFASAPALNSEFIAPSAQTERVFAVQDGSDTIVAHSFYHVDAVRKLPYYGIPSNLAL